MKKLSPLAALALVSSPALAGPAATLSGSPAFADTCDGGACGGDQGET